MKESCLIWAVLIHSYATFIYISCRSFSAKEPLIIGLFCGKRPVKIRYPMGLHTVWINQVNPHMNGSYHSYMNSLYQIWTSQVTHGWVMSHIDESCHTWMSHVTHTGTNQRWTHSQCIHTITPSPLSPPLSLSQSHLHTWSRTISHTPLFHTQFLTHSINLSHSHPHSHTLTLLHAHRQGRSAESTTHCNTLQHTATHCNTLQHTATHCNTLQHTATHCNTQAEKKCWNFNRNT